MDLHWQFGGSVEPVMCTTFRLVPALCACLLRQWTFSFGNMCAGNGHAVYHRMRYSLQAVLSLIVFCWMTFKKKTEKQKKHEKHGLDRQMRHTPSVQACPVGPGRAGKQKH